MKVAAIAVLSGFLAGGLVFFFLGLWQGKKVSDGGGGKRTAKRAKEKSDFDDDPAPSMATGKGKRVIPRSEWKRGRLGGGLS